MPAESKHTFTRITSITSGATAWQDAEAEYPALYALDHDIHDDDIANTLSLGVHLDIGGPMLADLNAAGYIAFTDVGAAVNDQDALRYGDLVASITASLITYNDGTTNEASIAPVLANSIWITSEVDISITDDGTNWELGYTTVVTEAVVQTVDLWASDGSDDYSVLFGPDSDTYEDAVIATYVPAKPTMYVYNAPVSGYSNPSRGWPVIIPGYALDASGNTTYRAPVTARPGSMYVVASAAANQIGNDKAFAEVWVLGDVYANGAVLPKETLSLEILRATTGATYEPGDGDDPIPAAVTLQATRITSGLYEGAISILAGPVRSNGTQSFHLMGIQ